VTITDGNGCITDGSVTITVGEPMVPEAIQLSGAVCNSPNGSAQVTVLGGSPPYQFVWSGGQFGDIATGLSPGLQTIQVTDANGCTVETNVFIDNADGLSDIDFDIIPISCFGESDASITVTPLDGIGPYTYVWSDGLLGATLNGVGAGTYTVTVTDISGCEVTEDVVVETPEQIVVTIDGNEISCETVGNGSASVTVEGGTEPYTYFWSNGETTAEVEDLAAGLHTVEVTDVNGCSTIENVYINQDDSELAYLVDITPISCFNGSDGGASVEILNGLPPYTFTWPTGETDSDITGLSEGEYTVFVEDLNGCTANVLFELVDPEQLVGNIPFVSNTTCAGEANGTATVVAIGGTEPYHFLWPDGTTEETGTGLEPGLTIVQITDARGCETNATVLISTPENVDADVVIIQQSLCSNASGIATVEVEGGVPPYTYLWTSGGTAATETEIPVGYHEVEVLDANGCIIIGAFFMNGESSLEVNLSQPTEPDCQNPTNGSANVEVIGGEPPYQIAWSTGETSETVTGLSSGEYDVTITDAIGCAYNVEFLIPPAVGLQIEPIVFVDESCPGSNDGQITLIVDGGVGPFSFDWSNGLTDSIATNLSPGPYTIDVEDVFGCTGSLDVLIETTGSLLVEADTTINTCFGASSGVIQISVGNGVGPYVYEWSDGSNDEDRGQLATGLYNVTVTDSNGCQGNESFIVFADQCSSDLSLIKNVSNTVVAVGDQVTYEIILTNDGPGNASSVEVFDEIPNGLSNRYAIDHRSDR